MNILLLGATGSIGDSVLSVIDENQSKLNLFGITFNKNINKSQEIIKNIPAIINSSFIFMILMGP